MWTLFRPCAKKRYRSDSVIYLLEAQYSVSLFLRKSYIRFYFDLCFGRMANKQITLTLLVCSVGKFRLKLKWAHPGKIDLLFFFSLALLYFKKSWLSYPSISMSNSNYSNICLWSMNREQSIHLIYVFIMYHLLRCCSENLIFTSSRIFIAETLQYNIYVLKKNIKKSHRHHSFVKKPQYVLCVCGKVFVLSHWRTH